MQKLTKKYRWGNLTLLTLMLAMLFAVNVSLVATHSNHDAPSAIFDHINGDDQIEINLVNIAPYFVTPSERSSNFTHVVITILHLSPNIFQPPEAV